MDYANAMRGVYEAVNSHDPAAFAALLADGFVDHEELPGLEPTKDGVVQFFTMMFSAFPDLQMAVEDVLVDGDRAVVRARLRGTNDGEFMGMPATGKPVDVPLIDIIRFDADGLAVEHWGIFNELAMMQQLGAIPEGPPA